MMWRNIVIWVLRKILGVQPRGFVARVQLRMGISVERARRHVRKLRMLQMSFHRMGMFGDGEEVGEVAGAT
jgi:hypothetical protein